MNKYIKADLYRIFTRVPRWILFAVAAALVFLTAVPGKESTATGVDNAELLESIMKYLPAFIGFLEIIYVFGEDFKGKTAQITIAIGVSRRRVVLAKWLEVVILAAIDTFSLVLLAYLATAFTDQRIPAQLIPELFAQGVICVVATGAYMALVMPILFLSQGTTLSMLLYMGLSLGMVQKLVKLLSGMKAIAWMHLNNFTLTNCLNVLRARLLLGTFHVESLLGVVLFIVGFLTLTIEVYRHRELEF